MRLHPQFANLSSSRMGAIGPEITSIEDVIEFPVKRMSKRSKIYSSSTHEGFTWSWSSHLQSLFVDLVNTVSRDNVIIQSNPVVGRHDIFHFDDVDNEVLQMYNSHTTSVLAASLHPSTSELPGDLRALKKQATLVLNECGDDWSPWNDRVN
jgi:hypothetical protein